MVLGRRYVQGVYGRVYLGGTYQGIPGGVHIAQGIPGGVHIAQGIPPRRAYTGYPLLPMDPERLKEAKTLLKPWS